MNWYQAQTLKSKNYTCGYCANSIASQLGYSTHPSFHHIYICHQCSHPTYIAGSGEQTPGAMEGDNVDGIPDEKVRELYRQARVSVSVNAFTATVLCCRIILMHVAVEKGAPSGQTFKKYVDYIKEQRLIPVGAEKWVDHIRDKGNEVNHEIILASKEDAREILTFTGMLLKMVYEFPSRMEAKKK